MIPLRQVIKGLVIGALLYLAVNGAMALGQKTYQRYIAPDQYDKNVYQNQLDDISRRLSDGGL
jgi:hypothetical protein